jgi:hypothetical protein
MDLRNPDQFKLIPSNEFVINITSKLDACVVKYWLIVVCAARALGFV